MKYLQSIIFVYIVENIILTRKLKKIVENILNITFLIYVFFEKKDNNVL